MSELVKLVDQVLFGHIDFGTIGILFCLMVAAEGFRRLGYIDFAAEVLAVKSGNLRTLMMLLCAACFVVSMLVTNDVSLIIFVPFTIQVMANIHKTEKLIKLIVLETIAANLGSMMTPFGNPQNVYLYQYYQMELPQFFLTVFPYGMTAFLLLAVILLLDRQGKESISFFSDKNKQEKIKSSRQKRKFWKTLVYTILFFLSIFTVIGLMNERISLLFVVFSVGMMGIFEYCTIPDNYQKSIWKTELLVLKEVNYGLLVKFVILFVVVGNISEIPMIRGVLQKIVSGNEFWTGVAASQFISNVPAAVMLSKFTGNGTELLLGTDIGGLGTLIASMASMISLEYYGKAENAEKRDYIIQFTIYNIVFLAVMCVLKLLL